MNTDNLEQELRSMIAEIVEIEPEKITSDALFTEDLGMDSMMALEILACIEKKYKIRIPESYLPKISNLKEVVGLVNKFLEK